MVMHLKSFFKNQRNFDNEVGDASSNDDHMSTFDLFYDEVKFASGWICTEMRRGRVD